MKRTIDINIYPNRLSRSSNAKMKRLPLMNARIILNIIFHISFAEKESIASSSGTCTGILIANNLEIRTISGLTTNRLYTGSIVFLTND